MKTITLFLCLIAFFHQSSLAQTKQEIEGAWLFEEGDIQHTLVLVDSYLSYSTFDIKNKKFINTWGGPYKIQADKLIISVEFNANDSSDVQSEHIFNIKISGNKLFAKIGSKEQTWKKTDDNNNPLSGVWRITSRKVEGKMNEMPLRDRRTLKILTGNRFQWIAINIKTGEFSGTGGGTYTFVDDTYTEHIKFFSRDNQRVGASLAFKGKLVNGQWQHSGLSSKGEPIYEIWSKMYLKK
ncbi:hypothetical protein [Olivibacter domesticus]|uniref:Membrane or secreted protein n=1 Tax=Olivibacter domesticus TaxID=407022 RepID=A0A1H7PER1_OLID1|nr:hypothetical protein [Olivibacter domesticus]SEL34261.1 hypothetical protein SAMN05661044_02219 [Olivibacter domesticus]